MSAGMESVMDGLEDESGSFKQEIRQSLPRLSLDDNGQRNWQEESRDYLDVNYDNWKNPQTTHMVPLVFKRSGKVGDVAEEMIFHLIEKFGQERKEPMFVIHSYDFAALVEEAIAGNCRREWLKGECDFVIIHRKFGLLVIEVKSADTRKEYDKGLSQTEKVRRAIASYSKKIFQEGKKCKDLEDEVYKYPGFVAMPNCNRNKSFHCCLFKEDCRDVESFANWWDRRIVRNDGGIPQDIYEALMTRLVPLNCVAPTLDVQINHTHNKITQIYTPEQLDVMHGCPPNQWITGPAGCGKTVLLIHKVKEIIRCIMTSDSNVQERVLVLCYNRPLSIYLRNEIDDWFKANYSSKRLHRTVYLVKTYDSFLGVRSDNQGRSLDVIRQEIEEKYLSGRCIPKDDKFHHIFVDEGQDFPGQRWPKILECFLVEDETCTEHYFWVMVDSNQNVHYNGELPDLRCRLKQAFKMTKVLRNSEKIFLESKKYFDGMFGQEIKLGHKEIGLNVVFDNDLHENSSNGVDIISKHIDKLLVEKVQKKDIVILTREVRARDTLINQLNQKYKNINHMVIENAERRLESVSDTIAVDSIRRFKGLESKVVIVYDPDYPKPIQTRHDTKARELLYIAISRCICLLVIVSTKEGCDAIKSGISSP